MPTYLEAYRDRLKRNQEHLLSLAKQVVDIDPTIEVYAHKDANKYIDGLVFFKEELINSIHFHEVPYRWSGCGYGEFYNSHYGKHNSSIEERFVSINIIGNAGLLLVKVIKQLNEINNAKTN